MIIISFQKNFLKTASYGWSPIWLKTKTNPKKTIATINWDFFLNCSIFPVLLTSPAQCQDTWELVARPGCASVAALVVRHDLPWLAAIRVPPALWIRHIRSLRRCSFQLTTRKTSMISGRAPPSFPLSFVAFPSAFKTSIYIGACSHVSCISFRFYFYHKDSSHTIYSLQSLW